MNHIDAETVIYRLEEAGRTMLCLPGAGCLPAGMAAAWPEVVRKVFHDEPVGRDPRLPIPGPAAIDRMDEALGWVGLIELTPAPRGSDEPWSRHGGAQLRKIVLLRAMVSPRTGRHIWSWRRLGLRLNASHEAVRQWHAKGIDTIVMALRDRR